MMDKIILGTAQFGMDYGINNTRGKIPRKEVFEILKVAMMNHINYIDTAYAYDESEEIIGNFSEIYGNRFFITSKLPEFAGTDDIIFFFNKTLEKLNIKRINRYMIHDFKQYNDNPIILETLLKLKKEDKIDKIGISLYYPCECLCIDSNKFDFIQIPYNVFDRRFEQMFPMIKHYNMEIITRSVFLQGMVFKLPFDLNNRFLKIKDKLIILNQLSIELNIPISALCLQFVLHNKHIDKVIIGVDSTNNLKQNISSINTSISNETLEKLSYLQENDEQIIVPTNWD